MATVQVRPEDCLAQIAGEVTVAGIDGPVRIVRDRWGRGYAPEAAAACTAWAFDTLGWSEVIHTIAPGNASSKAVAAKLGSRFIGMGRLPEPSHEKPVEIWGQTRAEWRARKEQAS